MREIPILVSLFLLLLPLGAAASATDESVVLAGGRVRVSATFVNHYDGSRGVANAIRFDDEVALFSFGGVGNPEVVVRVEVGEPGEPVHLVHGSVTDFEYRVRFENRCTGGVVELVKEVGRIGGGRDDRSLTLACEEWKEQNRELLLDLPGGVPLVLRRIPAASFLMGSPDDEVGRRPDEGPRHRVTLSREFWIGKFEVTQAEWEALMGDNPSAGASGYNYPVTSVSLDDITRKGGFLDRLNRHFGSKAFRLPTEAEWEFVARTGVAGRFPFGEAVDCSLLASPCPALDRVAVWAGSPESGMQPVGSRAANEYGVHDMLGNAYEWVGDRYGPYPTEPQIDPRRPEGAGGGVVRGGSWMSWLRDCRPAARFERAPHSTSSLRGFRVVMDVVN